VVSEQPREEDPSLWGIWNHVDTLACDGHRDHAEDEAQAAEKHYRLIPVPLNG
jgi:hypothetical protein